MELKLENLCNSNLKNISIIFKSSQVISLFTSCENENLLRVNTNQQLLDSGTINIINPDKNLSENYCYLPKNFANQFFNINVFEDIKISTRDFSNQKFEELLDIFNLEKSLLDKNYTELSTGELKKISLIKVFMENKNYILLEDPSSYLDDKSKQSLIKIIRKERLNGKTILINSFDTGFVLKVSDRVVIIYNGKKLIDDTKYNVLSNKKILDKINVKVPNILEFKNKVLTDKNIKLGCTSSINDLIKDVYRNVKKNIE